MGRITTIIIALITLIAFTFKVTAQDQNIREILKQDLIDQRDSIMQNMHWKDRVQSYRVEIDMVLSARAFTVSSDLNTLNKNGEFIKNGGGLGFSIGNGNWQVGSRFSFYNTGLKERLTTDMYAISFNVVRKFFLDQYINKPFVLYTGFGFDRKTTTFSGIYTWDLSEAGLEQVNRNFGDIEYKLGTVNQLTPYVKLGLEYVFTGMDMPLGIFIEVDNHFSGVSNSNYVDFQNTNVTKDLNISFGFRLRKL